MGGIEFCECDYKIALKNWKKWEASYEAKEPRQMPLLKYENYFYDFIREYRLHRGISKNSSYFEDIRVWMIKNIPSRRKAFAKRFYLIEEMLWLMKRDIKISRCDVSLISKILSIAWPEIFAPIDDYNKRGSKKICEEFYKIPISKGCLSHYGIMLRTFRCVFIMSRNTLKSFLKNHDIPTSNMRGFQYRVLDVALMRIGGREDWGEEYEAVRPCRDPDGPLSAVACPCRP